MERSYNPGDEYVFIYNGETHNIVVLYDNGDGIVVVSIDGGEPSPMAKISFDEFNATYIGQNVLKEPEKKSDDKVNAKVEIKKAPEIKSSKLKEKVNNFLSGCGCLIILLFAIALYMFFTIKKDRQKKSERVQYAIHWMDSIARAQDSIIAVKSSKEYKDSMRVLHEKTQKMFDDIDRSMLVIVVEGDSCFHYMTQCVDVSDMKRIKFMSQYDALKKGYVYCGVCHYDDDEYIYIEDICEYISDNHTKSEIADMFDITSADIDDY